MGRSSLVMYFTCNINIRRKNEVPKLLSKINNNAADNKTGKETIPIIIVTKSPNSKWNLVIDIPFVLK
jgi:hypothetical protein